METSALRRRAAAAASLARSRDELTDATPRDQDMPVFRRRKIRKFHLLIGFFGLILVVLAGRYWTGWDGETTAVIDSVSAELTERRPHVHVSHVLAGNPARHQGAPPSQQQQLLDCRPAAFSSDNEMACALQRLAEAQRQIDQLQEQVQLLRQHQPKTFPTVRFRGYNDRKRILVTGGAGFVGSHLVDRLMLDGHEVRVLDNLYTGRKRNVEQWLGHENFELHMHDVVNGFYAEVDEIYHLASPASPPHYMANPVRTVKTSTIGTLNMLGLAKRVGARILIASTSEVYGDPEVHPQPESYWGHVNPIGPRACYDEAKRVSETLAFAYLTHHNISVRVARIFNTYGPRMHNNDGRVVSNFILQALQNTSLTVYGSGTQTRSFQYVSDLVEGLVALMVSNNTGPVNLGNPVEHTIKEFAELIRAQVGGASSIEYRQAVVDDPQKRRPDISLAKRVLNWAPKVPLSEGIAKTVEYFRQELKRQRHGERNLYDPLIDWAHISSQQQIPQIDGV